MTLVGKGLIKKFLRDRFVLERKETTAGWF
jgi:hypothetical protein